MPITAEDEDLIVRLECDPETMLHIGGPRPEADVRAAHKRRLDLIEKGRARMYKAASKAIARKIGMENRGEFENEGFAGVLRCSDWRIDLR